MKNKIDKDQLSILKEIERKVSWLSAWIIHNANNIRPSIDGLKVGGHQASSASVVSILVALYFKILKPEDRVAVKPHASPVFHAIQYILGNQTLEKLEKFRGFNGAQSYPSRTKDTDDVDFSTGSVGLGGAVTIFASLIQDYIIQHNFESASFKTGKMVALLGDAELDEGNVYEALLEGAKQNVRNCWWIIDYNRQSLDAIVTDTLKLRIDELFESMDWRVITLKFGKKLQKLSTKPGGKKILSWIDNCPNDLYSALVYSGGKSWREHLLADLGKDKNVCKILNSFSDLELADIMTNLAGNDLESVIEAFDNAGNDDIPTCFIAYTIKGFGLPLAGHKDNHAGLMNTEQMNVLKKEMNISDGDEWKKYAGLKIKQKRLETFISDIPFNKTNGRNFKDKEIPVPELNIQISNLANTQEAFGRILNDLGKNEGMFSDKIVTMSPDVTVSTNLGSWVNQRKIYNRNEKKDLFKDKNVISAQKWSVSPKGQHFELGIAENNLFLHLAAAGLSHSIFGTRLIPIGTIYDTFISRGLDALNYAVYQDARFLLIATPSGISLGPEGGAHQSIVTPLIGIGQPNLAMYEPAYVDELKVILKHSFKFLQSEEGSSVYIRLSTRSIPQLERKVDDKLKKDIISGGYWLKKPTMNSEIVIIFSGPLGPEVQEVIELLQEDIELGVLVVTSSERLYKDWKDHTSNNGLTFKSSSFIESLFSITSENASIVTILDGHSSSLAWVGGAVKRKSISLGIDEFGQSGNLKDLYRKYKIDSEAVIDACAKILA